MVFDAAGPAALAVVKALVFGAVEGALLATAKKKKTTKKQQQTEKTMRRQRNQNKTVYSSNLI